MSTYISYTLGFISTNSPEQDKEDITQKVISLPTTVLDLHLTSTVSLFLNNPNGLSNNININDLGINRMRTLLLESDYQFGYSFDGNNWMLTKLVFIDYSSIPTGSLTSSNSYVYPTTIYFENPLLIPSLIVKATIVGT